MAKRAKKKTTAPSEPLSAPTDPIRIVPLRVPRDLLRPTVDGEAAVAPRLTYRNGPLMTGVGVVTIFWGSGWKKDPPKPAVAQQNELLDRLMVIAGLDPV